MKHYPHHIGDFNNATRHLTRVERSVYRDMLDMYYDTERPLTLDKADLCRKLLARSNEETTAVEQALNEFFTETPTGWYHERCEMEIAAYRANSSQKAQAGKASAEAKRLRKLHALNGTSTTVEQPLPAVATDGQRNSTNHEPSTNQPITKKEKRASAPPPACPDDVDAQVWTDWLGMRKGHKAAVTPTVIAGAVTEAHKAGMTLEAFLRVWCLRGSRGLEASWLKPHERSTGPPSEPEWRREQRERNEAFAGRAAARPSAPKPLTEVFDVTARSLD